MEELKINYKLVFRAKLAVLVLILLYFLYIFLFATNIEGIHTMKNLSLALAALFLGVSCFLDKFKSKKINRVFSRIFESLSILVIFIMSHLSSLSLLALKEMIKAKIIFISAIFLITVVEIMVELFDQDDQEPAATQKGGNFCELEIQMRKTRGK